MAENKQPSAEKLKALQAAMAKIDKEFGKGAIMKLGDENIENVPVIPTGSLGLNYALGVGGYPKGRIIEIYDLRTGIIRKDHAGYPRDGRGTESRRYRCHH